MRMNRKVKRQTNSNHQPRQSRAQQALLKSAYWLLSGLQTPSLHEPPGQLLPLCGVPSQNSGGLLV